MDTCLHPLEVPLYVLSIELSPVVPLDTLAHLEHPGKPVIGTSPLFDQAGENLGAVGVEEVVVDWIPIAVRRRSCFGWI